MAQAPFRLRAGTFDIVVAGFAAVAIGFAGFALPEWRLFQLLSFFHVPDILSFAQPPLGLKARMATALLFGGGAFGGVYLLMRMLDRLPAHGSADADPDEDAENLDALPMRLRRADAHPDNPVRRPLGARDLGEPLDALVLEAVHVEPASPPPVFPTPEPIAARAREAEVVDFVEIVPPAAVTAPAPEPFPAPRFEQVADASAFRAPEPAPIAPAVAAPGLGADLPPPSEESISTLMERLESGLKRRETVRPAPAPMPPVTPPVAQAAAPMAQPPITSHAPQRMQAEDSISERLRTAMSDLQRLAART